MFHPEKLTNLQRTIINDVCFSEKKYDFENIENED
jgi:hypothetical protein